MTIPELRIGSLFAGYGGLDLGIEAVLDARTAWVSEIDPGACKVLASRFPRFVEWMMGLPAGWVTDIEGVSRASQLQMLGNGVVLQQAAAALTDMLPNITTRRTDIMTTVCAGCLDLAESVWPYYGEEGVEAVTYPCPTVKAFEEALGVEA